MDMSAAPATPAITVAMSVYNNAPFLRAAIDSILAQSFGDFEFLIVNDGSSDGSSAIIDSYAAADRRVRAIHQPNRGLVASLNRMIDEARAPLIARMDGDDICLPDRFAHQLAFLERNPDFGVVGAWATSIDEHGRNCDTGGLDQPTSWEGFLDALWGKPLMCHPAATLRTDVLKRVGGYRALYRHCEDYDLWLRLSEVTKLCSLPERLILYRYSDSQVSTRHIVAQTIGAAVAWFAHLEREAGRPDPTEALAAIPPVAELDRLFGRPGVAKAVRDLVAPGLVYSEVALAGEGFDMLLDHLREGGRPDGLWRTAARLMRFGQPRRALTLATALVRA
jgi:GT2 family glycosyltransferase